MIAALARLPVARLTRSPRAWLPIVMWAVLAIAVAALARAETSGNGANVVLTGAFGGLALPFASLAIVSAIAKGDPLGAAGRSLVNLGASALRAGMAAVGVAVGASAIVGLVLATIVVLVAGSNQPTAFDVFTSAWVSALGGAAYGAMFALASTVGRPGGWLVRNRFGQGSAIVLDWMLGTGNGLSALFVPRGHVRSLLGGLPPDEVSQATSTAILLALALTCALLAIRRTRT